MLPENGSQFLFDLNSVIPRPEVLEGTVSGSGEKELPQNLKALEETGYLHWYDWSMEKWGTKWNSYEFRWVLQEPNKLVFTFQTAWSSPHPVFEKLIELYPQLEFSTMSFDEMWNWACRGRMFDGRFQVDDVTVSAEMYKSVYGEEPDITPLVGTETIQ